MGRHSLANHGQRASFDDPAALDTMLTFFGDYACPEVCSFYKALEHFSADVPRLAETLRAVMDDRFSGGRSV